MNRGLAFSLVLHASLFALVLLGPGPARFEWERVEAISVDLVAPPVPEPPAPEPQKPAIDPTPEPAVKRPAEEVKPPEPSPVEKPAPKPRPRKVYRSLAPKRSEDDAPSLEERLQARLREGERAEPIEKEIERAPAASSRSTEVEATDFPYAWYLNVLQNKITDSWDPPGTRMIDDAHNRVLVRFRIHRDGRVTDVRVEGASGSPGLDASARRAVDLARPFPPLPEGYDGDELEVGVRFTASAGGS